jgi:hypothetical protein
MRQNWLSNRIFESFDDIADRRCYAWNTLTNHLGKSCRSHTGIWPSSFTQSEDWYKSQCSSWRRIVINSRSFSYSSTVHLHFLWYASKERKLLQCRWGRQFSKSQRRTRAIGPRSGSACSPEGRLAGPMVSHDLSVVRQFGTDGGVI